MPETYHPYPGNGPHKRLARHALYQLVRKNLPTQTGQAITLAGPDAPEVPYLRGLLRRDPAQTWFVDVEKTCIADAQRAWPQVRTFHGTLLKAIGVLPLTNVNFANLDFMGQYNDRVAACVRLLAPRLAEGAILALTYKRGLELTDHPHMRRILRLGRAAGGVTYEDRRRLGVLAALRADLDRPIRVLDTFEYWHPYSAMTNLVIQRERER